MLKRSVMSAFRLRAILAASLGLCSAAAPAGESLLTAHPTRRLELPGRVDAPAPRRFNLSAAGVTAPPSGCVVYSPTSTTVPAEIVELARGLKYDPALIFQYVHDNVQFDPVWGSMKGAWGTLVDGRGGAADQAALLVALLNQAALNNSAITSVQFVQGSITLTAAQVSAWLQTDTDVDSVYGVLAGGSYPVTLGNFVYSGTTLSQATVPHVWVQVTVSGKSYNFDPAFKQYGKVSGINIASAMGYSQAKYLSDLTAGSTAGPASIQFSSAGIATASADLNGYAQSLIGYIKANAPTASLAQIIGGGAVAPVDIGAYANFAPITPAASTSYATIPNSFRASLSLTLPGATCEQFYSSDIYGQRLSIVARAGTAPVMEVNGISVGNLGSTIGPGDFLISEYVNLPWQPTYTYNSAAVQYLASGSTYVVMNGWDQVGRGMVQTHQRILANNIVANGAGSPTAEPVLGESLNVMGFNWLAENAQRQQIADQLEGVDYEYLYGVGIVGLAYGPSTQGPYTDIPIGYISNPVRFNGSLPSAAAQEAASFFDDGDIASGFEAGVIRQASATGSNTLTASTTAILAEAMTQQLPIYFLQTAADFNTYSGQLGWPQQDVTVVQCYMYVSPIPAGCTNTLPFSVLAPAAPSGGVFTFGSWTGIGFSAIYHNGGTFADAEEIGGSLNGGFPGTNIPPATLAANLTADSVFAQPDATDLATPPIVRSAFTSGIAGLVGDPTSRQSGAFSYSHDDLTTGSLPFPYGLGFQRIYSSSLAHIQPSALTGGLGRGWTHNYAYAVSTISDGFDGMGATTAAAAAGVISASYVSNDLQNGTGGAAPTITQILGATFANQRLIDDLVLNVEAVSKPTSMEHFVSIPGTATYADPVGSTAILSQNGTKTIYQASDASTLTFDSSIDTSSATTGVTHVTSWASPVGVTVNLSYAAGYLQGVKNNLGPALVLSGAPITGVSDVPAQSAAAHRVAYTYGANNTLATFVDAASNTTSYDYDTTGAYYGANGHLTEVLYPSGKGKPFLTNTYDSLGRIEKQKDGDGNTTQAYLSGYRTELANALKVHHAWYLDGAGRTLSDIQDLGGLNLTTTNVYDGQGNLTLSTAPQGDSVSTRYDALFNPLVITRNPVPGSPEAAQGTVLTTVFTYTKPIGTAANDEEVYTSQDANKTITTYVYFPTTGELKEIDQPPVTKPGVSGTVVPKQLFTYTGIGLLQSATDAESRVTQYVYDTTTTINLDTVYEDYGRLNVKTAYSYDGYGNRTKVLDPDSHATNYGYDALRRLTSVTADSSGNNGTPDITTNTTYDSEGRQTSVQRYVGATPILAACSTTATTNYEIETETYDLAGNLTKVLGPRCDATIYTYDAANRLSTSLDATSQARLFSYDNADRLLSITDTTKTPGTVLETHTWFADGQAQSFADANANVTSYAYNGFVRLTTSTFPGKSTESFVYDANGNLTQKTTRAASVIKYGYDALNRLTTKTPAAEPAVTYGYDETGLPLLISNSEGAFNFAYNTAGQETQESKAANGRGAFLKPDAAGNLSQLKWADGYAIDYKYDGVNRLKQVIEDSSQHVLATYGYDPLSRRTSVAFGDGSSAAYGYDQEDDLTSLQTSLVGSSITLSSTYSGDRQRLTAGSTTNLPFPSPAAGSVSYATNTLNQYAAVGSVAPSYDTAGDLTNDGIFAYTYDAESRLLSATGKGHKLAFDWDAEGRLATTTLDGTATSYDYNGTTPMGDWTGTAFATGQTQSRRHVFGAGGDPLYLTVNGLATYSHPDILGSTIALSNATASPVGALSAAFNYDPFGQPVVPLTSTFGYAGQRLEPTTGLIYDGARFYSPAWGRFYSPDPIGYAGGNNLYAYVGNDPLNNTDPFGLAAQQVGSSQWNLTTAYSQSDLDQLNIRLFNARNAGNWSVVSQILAEIDNLTGAVTGPTAGPIAPPAQQTGPKLIGTFTVPENLKFGTTLFGNYAHLQAQDILESLYGEVGLTFYVKPGQTGVDVEVREDLIAKVGFAFAEIKPLSASGLRTYKRQIRRWGLDPNQTQAITYDANGNLFFGFQ